MDIFMTQTRKTIAQGCSVKKVVLKISQNSQKKIGVGVSLLKLQAWGLLSFRKFLVAPLFQNTSGGTLCIDAMKEWEQESWDKLVYKVQTILSRNSRYFCLERQGFIEIS